MKDLLERDQFSNWFKRVCWHPLLSSRLYDCFAFVVLLCFFFFSGGGVAMHNSMHTYMHTYMHLS